MEAHSFPFVVALVCLIALFLRKGSRRHEARVKRSDGIVIAGDVHGTIHQSRSAPAGDGGGPSGHSWLDWTNFAFGLAGLVAGVLGVWLSWPGVK